MTLLLVFLQSCWLAQGQASTPSQVPTRDTIEARLKTFAGNDLQREATLENLFQESGCIGDKLSEQPVKHLKESNVVCALRGQTDSIILVGAHFDHVSTGDGVADNWSGASLLPSLFYSLRSQVNRCTFLFVGFAGEEKGLVGSRYYVQQLAPELRARIKAMVNFDTLGLGPTKVWVSHADPKLFSLLEGEADDLGLPLGGVNVDGVGSADSEPFSQINIPRITIHSVTQETFPILHSKRDKIDAVNMDDYYATYRLLAGYLRALDNYLGRPAPVVKSSQ
jgi:Peptidase family M28